MRYTRYDFKKKNNDHVFFICVIIIFLLSFFIGTGIFKLIFGGAGLKAKSSSVEVKTGDKAASQGSSKYFIVQCGVLEKQENAQAVLSKISSIGNPFIVQDGKYYKVIYGIVNEKSYSNVEKLIKSNNVDISRTAVSLSNDDDCSVQIRKIIDAYLEIVNKLAASGVKDIQTKSIKSWCQKLASVGKSNNNYAVLKEFKDYTSKFPDKIDKTYIKNLNLFLYKELKKIK